MSGFLRRCHRRGKDGWLPGIAAAQRSGLESRGSWTETRASLWARHNCAGTSSLAVCSAAGCSPWCLRGLPCKTNIYSGGDSTACQQLLQQLLQCVPGLLLMLIWCKGGWQKCLPCCTVKANPPIWQKPLLCNSTMGMFPVLRSDLLQTEVGVVCETSLAVSPDPAQHPMQKLSIPADSQGA